MIKQITNKKFSDLSTLRVGGEIRYFFEARKMEDLIEAWKIGITSGKLVKVIGMGSNMLGSDKYYDGYIIKNRVSFIEDLGGGLFNVGGGELLSPFIYKMCSENYSGLEQLMGLPGTIGGAVWGNAGAYDQCMQLLVKEVRFLDDKGKEHILRGEECEFKYRHSIFKRMNICILSTKLQMIKSDENVMAVAEGVMKARVDKQPLTACSPGSYFKNPEGHPAGMLIDQCGLKGFSVGGAQISEMHANFFINTGGATRDDFEKLVEIVKKKVWDKFQIELEREVIDMGEFY